MRFSTTIIVAVSLFTSAAFAADPFEEALDLCYEREARSLATGISISEPVIYTNSGWLITWPDGSTQVLESDTPAEHVDEGRKPFVIKYKGELTLIIPWAAMEDEATDGVVCDGVPIR